MPPSPSSVYAAWLAKQGVDRKDFHEEPRWKIGDWAFYTLDGPFLDHPAAVGPAGVAARESPGGWYALLALPATDAAPRAAWLLGNPVLLGPTDPVAEGARVSAPASESKPPDRVLRFWVAWPPQVADPYRVVIRANADGTATIEETHWSEAR